MIQLDNIDMSLQSHFNAASAFGIFQRTMGVLNLFSLP